jgi:hypothetical protein
MPRPLRRLIQPVASSLARRFEQSYRNRSSMLVDTGSSMLATDASIEDADADLLWHEALHCLRALAIAEVGASRPPGDRLRRTAEVWLPVAPGLERRLRELTSAPGFPAG